VNDLSVHLALNAYGVLNRGVLLSTPEPVLWKTGGGCGHVRKDVVEGFSLMRALGVATCCEG
jgi:hypothetical protein